MRVIKIVNEIVNAVNVRKQTRLQFRVFKNCKNDFFVALIAFATLAQQKIIREVLL